MQPITPSSLKPGDTIRIIAPSRSAALLSEETRQFADQRLTDLGFTLTYGAHINESDAFASTTIASRVADIHDVFADPEVKGILTVIGGYNSNQLLSYLDWELIRKNPKVFCGFSDITALNNAILAKTGLITYSGPHYSTFAERLGFEYSLEYFRKAVMETGEFAVIPSERWSDDPWYKDQVSRVFEENAGYYAIQPGKAEGRILGGNLCTLNLLQGTEYMPDLAGSILFIEDDDESTPVTFDRDLQSLIHQPGFSGVRGVVIGRFQKKMGMKRELLEEIIKTKQELASLPVIAGADFGHTTPKLTIPIGGRASIDASDRPSIRMSR